MKVKDLQEARLAKQPQFEVVAEFLADGLECMGDPFETFRELADNIDPEGGLNKAINYVQKWNACAEFINKYDPSANTSLVNRQELEEWIRQWKDM